MRRHLIALLCVTTVVPSGYASGQEGDTGGMTVTISDVEGRRAERRDFSSLQGAVNIRECREDISIRIFVQDFPIGSANILDVWRGTGVDCSTAANRSDTTVMGCDPLTLEADQTVQGPEKRLNFNVTEVLDCEAGQTSEFDIFFLATNQQESTAEAAASVRIPMRIDTTPPPAPGNPRAINGQNQIGIRWAEPTGQNLRIHQVFIDPTGCGATAPPPMDAGPDPVDAGVLDAEAGDAGLDGSQDDAGTEPPLEEDAGTAMDEPIFDELPPGYSEVDCGRILGVPVPTGMMCLLADLAPGASSATFPVPEGLDIGDQIAVGVVAVDQAKNPSSIALTCAEVVPTIGFCEASGSCPSSCAVAAAGPRGTAPTLLATAPLLALLFLFLRRRHRC
jgi:hypothetical protein